MSPAPLTPDDWAAAGTALQLLWLNLALMFTAALSLGFAHAIIPSGLASGTFPQGYGKARPVLYIFGLLLVAVVIFNFVVIADQVMFIEDVYPKWYR